MDFNKNMVVLLNIIEIIILLIGSFKHNQFTQNA